MQRRSPDEKAQASLERLAQLRKLGMRAKQRALVRKEEKELETIEYLRKRNIKIGEEATAEPLTSLYKIIKIKEEITEIQDPTDVMKLEVPRPRQGGGQDE